MGQQGPARYWKVRGPRPGTAGRADPFQAVNYADLLALGLVGGGGGGLPPLINAGIGLERNGVTVDLLPAQALPGEIGGINEPPADGNLYVRQWDGAQWTWVQTTAAMVPPATDTILGIITEPPPDGLDYARTWDGTAWVWVEVVAQPLDFGDGLTKDDTATPPIVNLQPATDTSIGGIKEPPQTAPDQKDYVRRFNPALPEGWEWAESTAAEYNFARGLEFDEATRDVNLDPAGPTNMGGVIVPPRDATTQALAIDMGDEALGDPATGELRAPPATDQLLGALLEPPPDGISYVRQFDLTGQFWAWVEAATAGLQINAVIPDEVKFGPAEPDVLVHCYGQHFTPTCVLYGSDGINPAQPLATSAYVNATEMTFLATPDQIAAEILYTITVQDPAAVAPDPILGAGAEPFRYVESLKVAGETIDRLGIVYVPPDMGLQIATDGALAAVVANEDKYGVILDAPFGPATWVRHGEGRWVPAPLPTYIAGHVPDDAGKVFVPARTQGQGLTLEDDGGLYLRVATDQHLGGILEPSERDVPMARVVDPVTGLGGWEEIDGGMEEPPISPTAIWGRSSGGQRGWLEIEHTPAMEEPPASPVALWGRSSAGARGWMEVPTFDHLTGFVEKIGDTMQGFLTLHDDPVNPFHAATRNWVELELQLKVDEPPNDDVAYARKWKEWVKVEDAQGMEEPPANPVAIWGRSSAGDRGWLEVPSFDHLEGFVSKIGDTMTGKLTLDGPPVNPNHAATKDYVDLSEPQEAPYNGKKYARQDGQWVEIEPSEGGGIEEPPMQPVAVWGRTPDRGWVEVPTFDDVNGFVSKIGDTMTGALNLRVDGGGLFVPTQPAHAVNLDFTELTYLKDAPHDGKQYVREDSRWVEAEETGDTIEEPPMSPVAIWGRSSGGARGWLQIDGGSGLLDPALYVHVAGDTMQGTLTLAHEGALAMEAVTVSQLNTLRDEIKPLIPVGRSPINGLDSGYDDVLKAETIWVPLATDTLAGSIVEPPADGLQYARTNDTANGPAWVENIAKGVHTDDAPPMTPSDGALWWKSDTGALYVFYEDIDSGQWVQVNGTPSPDATISTGDTPPSNPRPNQLWFESDRGSLFFWYADADSSQWVEILGGSGGTAGSAPPVDLTGYATEAWTTDQIQNAVIDAQAFVTAAAEKQAGHDTDLCQQALKAVEGLAVSVKQLQKGHLALKARIQKLEAR